MTVRDKLKEINVRLVELAKYLNISRPTMYKYLELYEQQEFSKIDKITYDLLNYIDSAVDLSKPALMNYLINHILPANQVTSDSYVAKLVDAIRRLRRSNKPADKKRLKTIEIVLFGSNENQE